MPLPHASVSFRVSPTQQDLKKWTLNGREQILNLPPAEPPLRQEEDDDHVERFYLKKEFILKAWKLMPDAAIKGDDLTA